jgi:hypothetical protein
MANSPPRGLSPTLNPTGLTAVGGAVYIIAQWGWTASGHTGEVSPIIIAAAFSVLSWVTRFIVTPNADPKDSIGRPLVPMAQDVPPKGTTPPTVVLPPVL